MSGPPRGPCADDDVEQLRCDEDREQHRHPAPAPQPRQRLAQRVRQAEAQGPEAPQERCQQVLRQHARELDLKPHERPGADLPPQLHGRPHVDPPGHRVALEPARALLDPRDRAAVGFLVGGEIRNLDAQAHARQAHAQVGVLGDVPGVPRARPFQRLAAEELRRAAKGHDQPHARHAGQDGAEKRGVFDREAARQPVGARVVEVESALHAGDVGGGRGQMARHLVKLLGLGPVLGVPDADDVAAAETERVGERPWLGPDGPVGHDDDAQPARQGHAGKCFTGDLVRFFDHQHDVAEFARVCQARQPPDQLARHVRLVKQRHHDRDQGQLSLHLGRRCRSLRAGAQRGAERQQLQRDAAQKRERSPERKRRQQRQRRQQQARAQRPHRDQRGASRPRLVAGAAAQVARHAGLGLPDQLRAPRGQDRVAGGGGGAQKHPHRSEPLRQPGRERRELLGPGRGDIGHAADAPPGHDARVQAEARAGLVDEPRVGRVRAKVGHGRAPLAGQGAGQSRFGHPAVRQQDLAQRHVLALPHHDGFQKVAGIDRPILDQDLAKRALVAGGAGRRLRPRGRVDPVAAKSPFAQAGAKRNDLRPRRALAGPVGGKVGGGRG